HRPYPVAEVPLQLAEDGRRRKGGEGRPSAGIEAVDRVDEAEAGDLKEVVKRLAGAAIAERQVLRERQVAAHQLPADRRVAVLDEPVPESTLARQPLLGPRRRLRCAVVYRHGLKSWAATCPPPLPSELSCKAVQLDGGLPSRSTIATAISVPRLQLGIAR